MRTLPSVVGLLAGLLGMAQAERAQANCAVPSEYGTAVDKNSVRISSTNVEQRACPDPSGMLRQNVATGEAVRIPDLCTGKNHLDECVPKGKYRYGYAKPWKCPSASCWLRYFGEAEVTQELPADCQRTPDAGAPIPVDSVPWDDSAAMPCHYGDDAGFHDGKVRDVSPAPDSEAGDENLPSAPDGAVDGAPDRTDGYTPVPPDSADTDSKTPDDTTDGAPVDAQVVDAASPDAASPDAGPPPPPPHDDGCSMGAAQGGVGFLGVNAAMLLLGLACMARRRKTGR